MTTLSEMIVLCNYADISWIISSTALVLDALRQPDFSKEEKLSIHTGGNDKH